MTNSIAPLAGLLTLTSDTDSRVSVSVNDGITTWERDFFDYGRNHSLILLGFKPKRTNAITVTIRDRYRNAFTVAQPLSFITGPLPSGMPTITLITNYPDLMEPGYTMFRVGNNTTSASYVTFVDNAGQVVWYSSLLTPSDVHQLTNGDLFFPLTSTAGFVEANMLGQTVKTWTAPTGYRVDSHEDLITDHGTILYINNTSRTITNFPTSATNPNAPKGTSTVNCNRVVEMSATDSTLLNNWSLIDMLDPVRIDYLPFLLPFYGIDPEHANAVIDSTNDDSIVVSMRNQDAVVKFTRAGQIKWILGPHENWGPQWQPYLLTPVGTNFAWQYGQHAPIPTPQGTWLMYDDGNCRAEPFAASVPDQKNYSRAVEYRIDETNMTVSQEWEYTGTNTDRLYTDRVGNASWLAQRGNVLITYGYVLYENGSPPSPYTASATMVRIKEVTHDPIPSVVFDLELFDPSNTNRSYAGYMVYRSYRVPDLYAHPANPVTDLAAQFADGLPVLQFSADPVRTYLIQASDDLVNWFDLGAPVADDDNGDFSFQVETGEGVSAQFYRVVTE